MALNENAEQAIADLIAKNGMEPELGGSLREVDPDLTGLEPELGGALRQNAVYVDETTCIGCGHCAHVAGNTFFLEESYGRARVVSQDGDTEPLVQEAIDTCPVDCIHWVNYNELSELERARKDQVIQNLGISLAGDRSTKVKNIFKQTSSPKGIH
ncbi:ferredoxin-like protein [Thalassoporum mexicanum PCC 7367]|uniref:ferredoxin n=1 Tax=Thalassoporum mexicanum TaxID=3457544 RepID=UPI00029FAEFD|nr:ferredoxin [Pseudanabaena sp. PCC 7367]AFY69079.1 ferredoxin-like protein [Pseudanabaena sp. PCC 7367]